MDEKTFELHLKTSFSPSDEVIERTQNLLIEQSKRGRNPKHLNILYFQSLTRSLFFLIPITITLLIGIFIGLHIAESKSSLANYKYVKFQYVNPHAEKVSLSGDFTEWEPVDFEKKGPSGIWEIKYKIKVNGRYKYIFIIDENQLVLDPSAEMQVSDGYGEKNSVIRL